MRFIFTVLSEFEIFVRVYQYITRFFYIWGKIFWHFPFQSVSQLLISDLMNFFLTLLEIQTNNRRSSSRKTLDSLCFKIKLVCLTIETNTRRSMANNVFGRERYFLRGQADASYCY